MHQFTPFRSLAIGCLFMILALPFGCIHHDFEAPADWDLPEGTVLTVQALRDLYANEPIRFDQDYAVYATVSMDDKSGNIYRSAYIQDHTAAINLRLAAPGALYKGDSIRLLLRGTTLNAYQGMLQLDDVNADRNIEKLAVKTTITPLLLSIPAIRSGSHQGKLIKLDDVQFIMTDVGQTFADKDRLISMNRTLEDCDGNRLIVRTSGYANFADSLVPEGSGSLVAVVSQFQNEMQLFIRDYNEVSMTDERCAIPGDDYQLISIAQIRQNFRQGDNMIPANSRLEGVVISDRENSNHPGQNLYVSDESGSGMAIRFSSFHDFDLGTRVRLVFGAPMPMSIFRGLIQIDNMPLGNAFDLGPGTLPEPTTLTIAQAAANLETYQSTLVRFENVTITGGQTFSGNLTLTDQTGQMLLYTYNWASFAGQNVPAGMVNITGILSTFDNPQLLIRSPNDITQ